jgi:hypothetical protein
MMSQGCTRCEGCGFLNAHQLPDEVDVADRGAVLRWIRDNQAHDVVVCDCCGDGEHWYGVPGEHYNDDDPPGNGGPYAYNGGLCECN